LKRKSELKQVQKDLVQQGHKPFYFKQSDIKKVELAAKYQELKKSGGNGKIDRAIEKKRKRNATKAHKFVPYARRDGDGGSGGGKASDYYS
jgi:ribosomal RNA-processing protein 36